MNLNTAHPEITPVSSGADDFYYGRDFSITPERFTDEPGAPSSLRHSFTHLRDKLLANKDRVALIKKYTMTGDRVADAYANLLPQYGFRGIVQMLEQACDEGIEAVPDAPEELKAFIQDMERVPDWLDMAQVEEGARLERNASAHIAPFAIRGAFIATFMNKYTALPMAMTGRLSGTLARKRVLETATFFTATIMPGALERFGAGFKSAAKVRLMHSMVRIHALRSDKWDSSVYGMPIPQVDQMPAGLIGIYLMSMKVLRKGRQHFTASERARVELARYRCFLLGLPEALLGETPQEIADLMMTRQATIRRGFDDATCGELVRATMNAELYSGDTMWQRIKRRMEWGFAKLFFVNNFCEGDYDMAKKIGVTVTLADKLSAGAAGMMIFSQLGTFNLAQRIPGLKQASNRILVRKLDRLLEQYGHAEFESDAAGYRPAKSAT